MNEQFISEPIEPEAGSFDATDMARGEPGTPGAFTWRGRRYEVTAVEARWKESGPSAEGEVYLRRHWFKVRTDDGRLMQIYLERQPRAQRPAKGRWWLYTIAKKPRDPSVRSGE